MTLAPLKNTPSFHEFDPRHIPYQAEVIDDVYHSYDYSMGIHEVLLSGSVGSAKSILMAHMCIRHCIENNQARVVLGRKALPDLKATIYQKICEHLEGSFKEGRDYVKSANYGKIRFKNGSEIISRSWSDKRYKKMRSLELSMAVIEELTENNDEDKEAYDEIKMRVGRLPHIKKPLIIAATNPDAPSHWAYKYFIDTQIDTRHVYYSVTTDNPFLPPQYISQLKHDLDPKLAERMIYGRWVDIAGEVIYHQYNHDSQFINSPYSVDKRYPVYLSWDFNIADGKPMSMCCVQYIDDHFHVFNEVVVHGARTADTVDELESKGLLLRDIRYGICGDATGSSRDTRGARSDYDIIRKEMAARDITYEFMVPPSNPAVRLRHNTVNAYCRNANGLSRLTVYRDAPTVADGLRMTKLKKGAGYIEDDSKAFQHVTTALGYCMMFLINANRRRKQGTVEL